MSWFSEQKDRGFSSSHNRTVQGLGLAALAYGAYSGAFGSPNKPSLDAGEGWTDKMFGYSKDGAAVGGWLSPAIQGYGAYNNMKMGKEAIKDQRAQNAISNSQWDQNFGQQVKFSNEQLALLKSADARAVEDQRRKNGYVPTYDANDKISWTKGEGI